MDAWVRKLPTNLRAFDAHFREWMFDNRVWFVERDVDRVRYQKRPFHTWVVEVLVVQLVDGIEVTIQPPKAVKTTFTPLVIPNVPIEPEVQEILEFNHQEAMRAREGGLHEMQHLIQKINEYWPEPPAQPLTPEFTLDLPEKNKGKPVSAETVRKYHKLAQTTNMSANAIQKKLNTNTDTYHKHAKRYTGEDPINMDERAKLIRKGQWPQTPT